MKWLIYILVILLVVFGFWWFHASENGTAHIDIDMKKYSTEKFKFDVSPKDQKIIFSILDIMAKNNVLSLGLKKGKLEDMGKSIEHVPPLQYLAAVFTNHQATRNMRAISKSSFKWNGFTKGFSKSMMKAHAASHLEPQLVSFSHYLHVDPNEVVDHTLQGICLMETEKGGFEGLIRYLIQSKN